MPDDFDSVIEEFIGVVRGRSANSSRQPSVQAKQDAAPKKGAKVPKAPTPGRGANAKSKGAAANLRGGGRPGGKARAQKRGRR